MAEPVMAVQHSHEWIRLKVADGWMIVVQQVPPRPSNPQKTTCALPSCKYDGHQFDKYTFRVSFEPLNQWKSNRIVHEPATSSATERKGPKLGITVTKSYWYHLDCFERIFDLAKDGTSDVSLIPMADLAGSIVAESRGWGPISTSYSTGPWLQYLLEKWVGVFLYQEFVDERGNFNEKQAAAIYGENLVIMDTGFYTSGYSILRRNFVESSYHFRGAPEVLESAQNLRAMRLSDVLAKGEQWAWELALIDEVCLEYQEKQRLAGGDTNIDGDVGMSDID
ncbi:MAG: hypothetical protein Q9195_008167 [Heterodermia aff. obscurata]